MTHVVDNGRSLTIRCNYRAEISYHDTSVIVTIRMHGSLSELLATRRIFPAHIGHTAGQPFRKAQRIFRTAMRGRQGMGVTIFSKAARTLEQHHDAGTNRRRIYTTQFRTDVSHGARNNFHNHTGHRRKRCIRARGRHTAPAVPMYYQRTSVSLVSYTQVPIAAERAPGA